MKNYKETYTISKRIRLKSKVLVRAAEHYNIVVYSETGALEDQFA